MLYGEHTTTTMTYRYTLGLQTEGRHTGTRRLIHPMPNGQPSQSELCPLPFQEADSLACHRGFSDLRSN